MGHLAAWGTCHLTHTMRGKCITPPRSRSGYAYFTTGSIMTREGAEIPVGQLTLDTAHANEEFGAARAMAHYSNTAMAVADVTVGEDAYGIWVSGALRPDVTPLAVRKLRASPLSGDWRRFGTGMELVAALSVNVQGYPIPRPHGRVSNGVMTSLVAAGMVPPKRVIAPGKPGALSTEDLKYLKRLAARERAEETEMKMATLDKAAALSRKLRAQEMASRVASSATALAARKESH